MAINFPWEMFEQAAKRKEQERQQKLQDIQGIGQSLSDSTKQFADRAIQQRQKTAFSKTINEMMTNPNIPQDKKDTLRMISPFLNASTAGQLIPPLLKSQKQPNVYRPFPGMTSEGGNPLVINESTGEVLPSQIKGKSSRPSASDLGTVTWETATPDEQQLAISLYNGNIRPYDLGYRERSKAVVLANEYATRNKLPAYQSFGGDTKAGVYKSFGSGKPAMNVLSLNTAIGHAGTAMEAYQGVKNTDQRWLNVPLNKLRQMSNNPDVVKLGISLNALQGELATVFKGSAGTDQEVGKWMDFLSKDLTPDQASVAIPQVVTLLKSRQDALENMRSQGESNRPGSGPLLSAHAKKVMSELNRLTQKKQGGLTPQEQAEFDRLDKKFGGKQ